MLRQILDAGYVDPELLQQLTEEQKEIIFFKIREEQIRKWQLRDDQITKREKIKPPKRTPRKISFLEGKEGLPMVVIIDDDSLRIREEEQAKKEADHLRKEAEELAKKEAMIVTKRDMIGPPKGLPRSESTFDEKLQESPEPQRVQSKRLWRKAIQSTAFLIEQMSEKERIEYQRRRASEIFKNLYQNHQLARQRAAEQAKKVEEGWKKSESEAKVFERNKRRSFNHARQLVAKGVDVDQKVLGTIPEAKQAELQHKMRERQQSGSNLIPTHAQAADRGSYAKKNETRMKKSSCVMPGTQPKTMEHAVDWFKVYEKPKGVGQELDGSICLWFHGTIDRTVAERLLLEKTSGSFLVRLSRRTWGYTVSVRGDQYVKHYMVDGSKERYSFIGPSQPSFKTLAQLITHYRTNPITWAGQELLLVPCEQDSLHCVAQLYADDESDEISAL